MIEINRKEFQNVVEVAYRGSDADEYCRGMAEIVRGRSVSRGSSKFLQ